MPAETAQSTSLLALSGVSKHFGGVHALADIDISFEAGKVHALVGENGAGKSTLGKLILGIHRPSAGIITLDGQAVEITEPAQALRLGLVGIAQELSLMPRASVLDNIALGREITRNGLVDRKATKNWVLDVMKRHDMSLDPEAEVGSLAMADRQKVEILRALGRDARLIIFDEPTARLATHQAKQLLKLIRALAEAGKVVRGPTRDVNYVIPRFVLDHLPMGLVGLFLAAVLAAAMSSVAAELNSLSTATIVDFYRRRVRTDASEAHYLTASKWSTAVWGLFACVVATYAATLGSLIEVVNRFGSFFYGSILGVFLLAMLPRARGRGAFYGLLAGMATVGAVSVVTPQVAFLWHNVIGALVVIAVGLALSPRAG